MLSADVTRYLTQRRALGYKLDDAERYLRAFAHCSGVRRRPLSCCNGSHMVAPGSRSANAMAHRLTDLIQFARFMQAEDPRHEHTARRSQAGHQSTRSLHLYCERDRADCLYSRQSEAPKDRGNGAATRNVRFAAIRAFMRYLEAKGALCPGADRPSPGDPD